METYKDLKDFEESLRKRKECPDIVKIDNIIYTMDNYDLEGREISFGNKRTFKGFNIETSNRYNKNIGFSDASIYQNDGFIRNDIYYYD